MEKTKVYVYFLIKETQLPAGFLKTLSRAAQCLQTLLVTYIIHNMHFA